MCILDKNKGVTSSRCVVGFDFVSVVVVSASSGVVSVVFYAVGVHYPNTPSAPFLPNISGHRVRSTLLSTNTLVLPRRAASFVSLCWIYRPNRRPRG